MAATAAAVKKKTATNEVAAGKEEKPADVVEIRLKKGVKLVCIRLEHLLKKYRTFYRSDTHPKYEDVLVFGARKGLFSKESLNYVQLDKFDGLIRKKLNPGKYWFVSYKIRTSDVRKAHVFTRSEEDAPVLSEKVFDWSDNTISEAKIREDEYVVFVSMT
jgi:hypothetical protein